MLARLLLAVLGHLDDEEPLVIDADSESEAWGVVPTDQLEAGQALYDEVESFLELFPLVFEQLLCVGKAHITLTFLRDRGTLLDLDLLPDILNLFVHSGERLLKLEVLFLLVSKLSIND